MLLFDIAAVCCGCSCCNHGYDAATGCRNHASMTVCKAVFLADPAFTNFSISAMAPVR